LIEGGREKDTAVMRETKIEEISDQVYMKKDYWERNWMKVYLIGMPTPRRHNSDLIPG